MGSKLVSILSFSLLTLNLGCVDSEFFNQARDFAREYSALKESRKGEKIIDDERRLNKYDWKLVP